MMPVLLYDDRCGLCASSVQFMLRHDRRGTLRFAPLSGRFAADVRARHPALRDVDSMVWLEPVERGREERVLLRSDAALAAAGYLGGWWRLALIARFVPRPLRDAVYRLVARHRHRWQAAAPACIVTTTETKSRFLD